MNKIIFTLALLCSFVFGQNWQFQKDITLHKDQFYVVYFTRDNVRKLFYFRWTLNKNHGIRVHLSYDLFRHQFIMYKNHSTDIYKFNLFPKDVREYMPPYLMLKYNGFNYEANGEKTPKNTANFTVYMKDLVGNISVDNIADVREIIKQELENDNKDKKEN
jgi:hypothetical protein